MAKANWLTISPMSGTGNATIRNIGSEHTGRLDRTTTVTGKAVGIASEKTYSVVQHAKSEFVAVNDASYQVVARGGTVTVSGTSNSPVLTVTVDDGGTVGTLTVNGSQATNGQNIPGDPGAGSQYAWQVQIQVSENPTVNQRSLTVRVQGSSSSIADTIEVVQVASSFTYEYVPSASVDTIAASGGNSVISAQLRTYRNGSLVSTQTVTPTLTGSATGFSISGATVTAASRGTTVGGVRSITVTCNYVTSETGETLSDTVEISQAANSRVTVYGKPTITSFEVADIPASGGSVSSGDVEYSQSRHYYYDSGVTEELSPLTTGGQVTFGDPVTAESLGTTVKSRTIVGQLTCQVAMNGQTSVEGDASVYQQENTYERSDKTFIKEIRVDDVSVEDPKSPLNLPAKGEDSSGIWVRFGIKVYAKFTSGVDASLWDNLDTDLSHEILDYFGPYSSVESTTSPDWTFDQIMTEEFSDGYLGVWFCYYAPENKTDNSSYSWRFVAEDIAADPLEKDEIFQAAGERTYSEITVNLSYPQASAAGGTVNPTLTYSQTWGWNGSTTGGGTITSGAQVSYSGTNIDASTGVATVASKGTTVSGVTTATTATVTVSMNGKTAEKSADVQQEANAIESTSWNTPVVTISPTTRTSPAEGETFILSRKATQTGISTYTSGTTSAVSNSSFTWNIASGVNWVTLRGPLLVVAENTSTSERTARVKVSATGNGSETGTAFCFVTQEAGVYLDVSPESLSFEASGGTKQITIDTNESWTIS